MILLQFLCIGEIPREERMDVPAKIPIDSIAYLILVVITVPMSVSVSRYEWEFKVPIISTILCSY